MTTIRLPGWAGAVLLVLLVPIAAWAEDTAGNAGPSAGGLDEYLAAELQFDEQQIAKFKSNVADMPEEYLKAMVQQMKAQRETQDPDQADINARDRGRRFEENERNQEKLADAKRHAERAQVEPYQKYWNYGYHRRRKYRGLFRRQGRGRGYGYGIR